MAISVNFDCIVVGSGNAGSCAALSAKDSGCERVLIIDKCPPDSVGGNGYYTNGNYRTVHNGVQDLLPLTHGVSPTSDLVSKFDMDPYTSGDLTKDIMRQGEDKSDPALVKALVESSRETVQWLVDRVGMPLNFSTNVQASFVSGRKFRGGMVLGAQDGGRGVVRTFQRALNEAGVQVWFDTPAVELITERGAVVGVAVKRNGEPVRLKAPAVVLASGGYEASGELRARYLGSEWERAKVQGTPYNTGDGLTLASSVGAKLTGDFTECSSACWDFHAPSNARNRIRPNQLLKTGYSLGLMLNSAGIRFVDEGEDFSHQTFTKFGKDILKQPGGFAFQVWDKRAADCLREEEYGENIVRKVWADSLEELADKLYPEGLESKEKFLNTLKTYNNAARAFEQDHPSKQWDPTVKDGLSTQASGLSLSLPKSNWALPIDTAPFLAIKVCCGITFTFGGLAIDPETTGVLSEKTNEPIKGLFCTGELVGGLFYNSSPGGCGLTAGAVFGRTAGKAAARLAIGAGP